MPNGRFVMTSPLLAASLAVAGVGLLSTAAPAQAAPGDCQQWGFPGEVNLRQGTGEILVFNSTGPNAGGPGQWKQPNGVTKNVNVAGNIDPSGAVRVTVIFKENDTWDFTGQVGANGTATGTRPGNVSWESLAPLKCEQQSPKEGPTISFDPILGGLVAHITDRSGVTSQCEYRSDFYTRTFRLDANATFDLKIVPAIPEFRDRPIDITCDNGTETHTSTFF